MAASLVQVEPNTQLKPSYIKFLQSTTQDLRNGRPGQFFNEDTGQVYDVINCVLVGHWVNRVKYPPDQTHGGGVLCKSQDGFLPAETVEKPLSDTCASCRYAWERNVNARGQAFTRDLCKRAIKLAVILKETGLPHYLTCGGKSEAQASRFLEVLKKAPILASVQYGLTVCPFVMSDFAFTVRSVREGNNAKMVFSTPRLVEEDAEFGPMYQRMRQGMSEEEYSQCG